MEKGDLELGEVDLIQDTVKSLLDCAENKDNHKNQFSQSIYMAPDEIKFTMEENTVQSILDCVKKEQSHTNQHSPSIFMVPQALRDHSPSLFNPRVVSIGPLHREDENVQAFEGRKANYLINLMSFINSPQEDILNLCVQKVYALIENLIAYEQSCETYNHIISYASTMDMLVNTQEDVAKLVHSGALQNRLGSNEEAANMINSICKDVAAVFSFYEQEWIKLNKYCNGYWPKNIAWLRPTYFSNPWNIIALIAGIILFALTVIQTIFSVNPVGNNN